MFSTAKKAALFAALLSTTSLAHAAGGHEHGVKETKEGITLGGFIDFQGAYVDQDIDRDDRDLTFANDTEIHVTVRQKADAGFVYGAVVELEADVTEDYREQGLNADKTYLFLESNLGRVELGSTNDAAARLAVDPSNFAAATGGTHGDYTTVIRFPATGAHGGHGGATHHLGHGDFIHHPSLPLHHMHGAAEDATKISYYSPRSGGFQFGGSFIPDTGNVGTAAGFTDDMGHTDFENVLAGGVQYQGRYQNVGIAASLTGQYGSEEAPNHNDLKAYAAGVNLSYEGFNVGAAYGDWNKSVTHPSPTLENGQYWSLGAGYSEGAVGTSVTYLNSEYKGNQASIVSLGADYALAPGLTPYAEVTFADLQHSNAAAGENQATAVLIGTQLNF